MTKTTKIISAVAVLAVLSGVMGQSVSAFALKERGESANAKYQEVRGQYLKEVNFYKGARQDFLNARTKYQQFKNAENKKALEDVARNYLEKAISSLIKRLETVKNWASNRGALPESEKQLIIAEINQDISWLQEQLSKIQTASPEAIKEEAKAVREYWKNHRIKVKRITGQILAARISSVITKAEEFGTKVDVKIQELKAAGRDTAQLEVQLADFNQKLGLARQKYEAAKAKFQVISNSAEADQLFREGHQFIKEANQYVRQAHAQLVQIVKEMRKMGATVEGTPGASLAPTK